MALEDKIKELLEGAAAEDLSEEEMVEGMKCTDEDDSDEDSSDKKKSDDSDEDEDDEDSDKKKDINSMKEEADAGSDNAKITAGKSKKFEDKKNAGEPSSAEPNNARNNVDKNPTSVKEHVDALVSGEELSEDFKAKAAVILEAAIADGVAKELDRLAEEHAEQLSEAVEEVKAQLVEDIDGFLTAIVEQWVEENEIALERGIKGEIAENFIDGLKTLFTEHYIEVPEEKLDILDEQAGEIETLTVALDESAVMISDLKEQLVTLTRKSIMEDVATSMTVTEKEKFVGLCEGLSFEDEESFMNKVKTIKESHFHVTKPTSVIAEHDTPVPLNLVEGAMSKYVEALSGPLAFKR